MLVVHDEAHEASAPHANRCKRAARLLQNLHAAHERSILLDSAVSRNHWPQLQRWPLTVGRWWRASMTAATAIIAVQETHVRGWISLSSLQ